MNLLLGETVIRNKKPLFCGRSLLKEAGYQ